MNKRFLTLGVLALALGAIATEEAFSQASYPLPTYPSVSVVNPTDLIPISPLGAPGTSRVFVTPPLLAAQLGYYKSAPATGFTFTFGAGQTVAMFKNTTTLSTGSITMAAAPNDGQPACFFTKGIITTLTLAANTGQTINDNVTSMAAAAHACYVYSASNASWDRSE